MSLSRQAMQTGLRRIGPRLSYPLHISHLYKLCARAAEHYGPQQAVARPERPKTTGPAVSLSGSESDSDSDDSFPLMEAEQQQDRAPKALGKWAGVGSIGGIIVLLGAGVILKDAIREFLVFFMDAVESWGPLGYLAYAAVYTGLEVLAVPAIPLTMTAGVIFGPIAGTVVTSLSGTLAATIAFLIARYAARDRVLGWARRNNKFAAIDRTIARNGFKFVTLLRLSPLFPLAVSNYLYGLTSVDLWSYVAGSWIGMLPGTYAYVSAGHLGKAALMDGEGSVGVESWQIALGLGVTLLAIGYVGRLAKTAIEEAEEGSDLEDDESEGGTTTTTNNNNNNHSSSGNTTSSNGNGTKNKKGVSESVNISVNGAVGTNPSTSTGTGTGSTGTSASASASGRSNLPNGRTNPG